MTPMLDPTHTHTPQENQIYDALTAGDQEAVGQLRADAIGIDIDAPGAPSGPSQPEPEPEPEPPEPLDPAAQFDADYAAAHARYQADNEAPEAEREASTAANVAEENAGAR
jgi:hypothetical protein